MSTAPPGAGSLSTGTAREDCEPARRPSVTAEELANALKGGDFKKREFETTEQYEARLAPKIRGLKGVSADGQLVLSFKVMRLQYDADRRSLKFGSEYESLITSSILRPNEPVVRSTRKVTGSYVGENAFGAKRTISRMEEAELRVSLKPEAGSLTWPPRFKPFEINIEPNQAKELTKTSALLVRGRLTAPYLSADVERFSPKIDAPYDITTNVLRVHVAAECATIVNSLTGDLIRTLDISPN